MRWLLVGLLLIHGLIHVMGFLKAFGHAELPQLKGDISKPWGVAWLLATLLLIGCAVLVLGGWSPWRPWVVLALLVSQAVIVRAWQDAKAGTVANLLLLASLFSRIP